MYRIILLTAFLSLMFYGCTPTETEDFYEANYSNQTLYRNYDNPDYWLVNVRALYTAKVYKNETLIGDTTYLNNALFYRDVSNSVWKVIGTFGSDSLAVILRTKDSAYVRCQDSLIYRIKFSSPAPVLIGVTHSAIRDSSYINIGSAAIQTIDSINSDIDKYLTYPKWKEVIQKKYF